MKKQLLFLSLGLLGGLSMQAQDAVETLQPLKVTSGLNADILVEEFPAADHLTLGIDNESTGFYSSNFKPINNGLPAEMPITSQNGVVYNIDYANKNALCLKTATTGTVTFKDPVTSDKIYLLAISANGDSKLTVTVNYSDGTTSTATDVTVPDWWNSSGNAADHAGEAFWGLDRIKVGSNPQGTTAVRLMEYAVPCDNTLSVSSITINKVSGGYPSILGFSTGTAAIEVSDGFNADLIAEKNPLSDAITEGIDGSGWFLYSKALEFQIVGGVPNLLTTNSGISYKMDATTLNTLRIGDTENHEVGIAGSPKASKVHILGTSGGGTSVVSVVINYTDETSSAAGSVTFKDWYKDKAEGDEAYYGLGRINGGGIDNRYNFRLFEGSVNADNTKEIKSITFKKTSGGTPLMMGISMLGIGLTPWIGSAVAEGDFYLYNVESGLWLQNNDKKGGSWTTRAELDKKGFDVGITANGEGYVLNPKFGHNNSINVGNLYMDTDAAVTVWNITPVADALINNAYNITSGTAILSADDNGYISTDGTKSTWQLVSKAERLGSLAQATAEKPIDATWLIKCNNFPKNDTRINAWTRNINGLHNSVTGDGTVHNNACFESWESVSIDMCQLLTGIPNGLYKLTVQGFYRDGAAVNIGKKFHEENEKIRSFYYGNGTMRPFMSICAGGKDASVANMYGFNSDGVFIPNSADAVSNAFFNGGYQNEEISVYVTDGTLKLGLVKPTNDGVLDDWTVFDNFKLTYLGPNYSIEDCKNMIYEAIDRISEYSDPAPMFVKSAISNANSKLSSTNPAEIMEAAKHLNEVWAVIVTCPHFMDLFNTKMCCAKENETVADVTYNAAIADAAKALSDGTNDSDFSTALEKLKLARKIFNAERQEDVYAGNVPADGDFYLYNVGQKRFLCGGADFGAHAALGFPGVNVTLSASETGFIVDTHLINNSTTSEYLSYNGYCDTSDKSVWNFVKVSDGIYNITRSDNAEVLLGYRPNTYVQVDTDLSGTDDPNNQWKLVTKADRDALLASASVEAPADATYLISSPGFNQREDISAWVHNIGSIWGRGGNYPDFVFECWNSSADFSLAQSLSGMLPGYYKASVQAYYRDGSREDVVTTALNEGEFAQRAYFVANDQKVVLPNILVGNGKAPTLGWKNDIGEFPDACTQAADFFESGLYKVSTYVHVGEDGILSIGVTKTGTKANDWVVCDNFRLEYYGNTDDPTSIDGIKDETSVATGKIYNLQGVEVEKASQRGVYIKNGKKFVVIK